MEYFLLGIVLILGIPGLIIYFIINKNKFSASSNTKPLKENRKTKKTNIDDVVYIKNEVFNYELKGVFYNDYDYCGDFYGYAKNTYDTHDKYSVGIFVNNKLAGFTPKGNYRLHNTINQTDNHQILCWGSIDYDEYYKRYYGQVKIPIGFTLEEIKNTEIALKTIQIQNNLFPKENKSISDYFILLENDTEIYNLLSNLKIRNEINYSFNLNMIPQLSKKLEENRDWGNLIKLENFKNQINDLSLKLKNSTLKRIEKAKLNLN